MKTALMLVLVGTLAATANAQTRDPREIFKQISQKEQKMYDGIEKSPDPEAASKKVGDQIRHIVLDAIKDVNRARVAPKDAYDWARLYNWAEDHRAVRDLTRLYLTSNPDPEKKLQDQLLLMQSYKALGEIDMLKETMASVEPVTSMDKLMFFYGATDYVKTIAAKEGNSEGLRVLDSIQQRMKLSSPQEMARERLADHEASQPGAPALTDEQKLTEYESEAAEENYEILRTFATTKAILLDADGKKAESLAVLSDFAKKSRADNPMIFAFGDTAPAFTVGKWLKGQPVEKLEKGKVYVIDFWGTKCGPCIAAFPHLKEMAKKYRGKAEFIGVCVVRWSTTMPYPDTPDFRVNFVKTRGSEMVDRVVEDSLDGSMVTNWLRRTGETSIPRLYVVDDQGKIAWYGQPGLLSVALDNCLSKSQAQAAQPSGNGTRR